MKAQILIDSVLALKAGKNETGWKTVDIDPAELSQEQREMLALNWDWNDSGKFFTVNPNGNPGAADASIETIIAILDKRIAEKNQKEIEQKAAAEKQAIEYAARIDAWIKKPVEERLEYSSYPRQFRLRYPVTWSSSSAKDAAQKYAEDHPEVAAAITESEREAKRLTAEAAAKYARIKEENRIAGERRKAEEKAATERRTQQIAAWVTANGTENQKSRLGDGLLPDQEIIDAIRSETYAPLKGFPRYQKLKTSDVCEGYNDYCSDSTHYHDCDFSVETADTLTAEEYDRLQEIKKTAPKGATVESRIHTGKCETCENTVTRIGFMVRIKVGELDFSREYGMDTAE